MSLYHDAHGPVQPDSFIEYAARARATGTPLPPLILDAKRCLPFHAVLTDEQADHDAFSRRTRRIGEASRELEEARGENENRVTGDPAQVAEWAGHSTDVLLRVYAKCISGQQDQAKHRILEATQPDHDDEERPP